jgi:uncharacterized RDD family membrane protein YckC
MNITRFRSALTCVVVAAAASVALSAQGAGQRAGTPRSAAQPADTAVERERENEERAAREQLEAAGRASAESQDQAPQDDVRFARPIVRVRQDYTLRAGDTVSEIRSVFGNVVLEGRVERDVVVVMGSARLASTAVVEGSLVVIGGSAVVDEGAAVWHDLVLAGGTLEAPAAFSPGGNHVVVGTPALGEGLQRILPWLMRGLLWGRLIVPDLQWVWTIVGILFLVYLVLNTVLDRPVAASADVLVSRPLNAFLGGLLVLILAVPVMAIVAASVIGLAIIPFLLCALVAAGLVGKTAVARAIGRAVIRPESPDGRVQAFATFTIGFALLVLAYMVPALGFVTWALTSVLGLGAATVTFRSYLRRERPAPAPPPEPAFAGAAPLAIEGDAAPVAAAGPVDFSEPPVDADAPARATAAARARVAVPPPPPPIYTEGLAQYPRATFLDRAAAFALDCILVAIINVVLGTDRYDGFYFALLLAYHIGFWAWKGTTLGGIVCNLRVVRTHGVELRFVDALVRGLAGVFSIAALGIGCFWMLNDPERQTWHDKIAGTLVVKVPRDLVLP